MSDGALAATDKRSHVWEGTLVYTTGKQWCTRRTSLTTLAHLSSALVSLCECLAVTIWSGYLPSSGLAGARATVLQEWLAETLGF